MAAQRFSVLFEQDAAGISTIEVSSRELAATDCNAGTQVSTFVDHPWFYCNPLSFFLSFFFLFRSFFLSFSFSSLQQPFVRFVPQLQWPQHRVESSNGMLRQTVLLPDPLPTGLPHLDVRLVLHPQKSARYDKS